MVIALGATVHRPGLSGDQLAMAESSKLKGGTGASGAHRLYEGGALPGHRHWQGGATTILFQRVGDLASVTVAGTAAGTVTGTAVHYHIFLERRYFRGLLCPNG